MKRRPENNNYMEIPHWFTKEKYLEYKMLGYKDMYIWQHKLFVSDKVFFRWKKELGLKGYQLRGKTLMAMEKRVKVYNLKQKGLTYLQISFELDISYSEVKNALYDLKKMMKAGELSEEVLSKLIQEDGNNSRSAGIK